MATAGEVWVKIGAQDAELIAGLRRAKAATDSTTKQMGQSFSNLKTQIAGMLAAIGVARVIQFSVEGAKEAATATAMLADGLRQQGVYSEAAMADLDKYAKTLQSVTAIQDDSLVSLMAYGTRIGIQSDQLKGATTAAIGLSRITGKDLESSMLAVGRAMQGNYGRLKMLIPTFKETGDASQDMAALMEIANKGFKSQAAWAQTAEGRAAALKVAIGNLAEKLGFALLPGIQAVTYLLTGFANVLEKIPQWVFNLIVVLGGAAAAYWALGKAIQFVVSATKALAEWKAIVAGLEGGANKVQAIIKGVGALIAVGGLAYLTYKGFGEVTAASAEEIEAAMKKAQASIRNTGAVAREASDNIKAARLDAGKLPDTKPDDLVAKQFEDQAKALAQVVERTKAATQADKERRLAAIGWTSVGDVWKKAMAVGAAERFKAKGYGIYDWTFEREQAARRKVGAGGMVDRGETLPMYQRAAQELTTTQAKEARSLELARSFLKRVGVPSSQTDYENRQNAGAPVVPPGSQYEQPRQYLPPTSRTAAPSMAPIEAQRRSDTDQAMRDAKRDAILERMARAFESGNLRVAHAGALS